MTDLASFLTWSVGAQRGQVESRLGDQIQVTQIENPCGTARFRNREIDAETTRT